MKMSFRVDMETIDEHHAQAIITELSRLRTGLGIQITNVQEINLQEHSDNYHSLIETTARTIIRKLLENGSSGLYDVENVLIHEYSDMLYVLFPEGKRIVQDLLTELNKLKRSGVVVKINTSPGTEMVPKGVFVIDD